MYFGRSFVASHTLNRSLQVCFFFTLSVSIGLVWDELTVISWPGTKRLFCFSIFDIELERNQEEKEKWKRSRWTAFALNEKISNNNIKVEYNRISIFPSNFIPFAIYQLEQIRTCTNILRISHKWMGNEKICKFGRSQ